MTDAILPGSDGMAGGAYDDEVTEAQLALLKDSFAHLDLDGWAPCGPPGWDLPGDEALPMPREPAGHPFIGMEKDYGFAPANVSPPRSLYVVVDGARWRITRRADVCRINGKRSMALHIEEV